MDDKTGIARLIEVVETLYGGADHQFLNEALLAAKDEYEELLHTDGQYSELQTIAVGDKMIPAQTAILDWHRDAERYRFIRDRMARPETGQPVWMRRGDDLDEAIDAAMEDERLTGRPL